MVVSANGLQAVPLRSFLVHQCSGDGLKRVKLIEVLVVFCRYNRSDSN